MKDEFTKIRAALQNLKKVEAAYPREVRTGGRYEAWHKATKSLVADEATQLCRMYMLAPFRLNIHVPDDSFQFLLRKEMTAVKAALKRRDGDEFARLLKKAYASNMTWAATHGGMWSLTESEKEAYACSQ